MRSRATKAAMTLALCALLLGLTPSVTAAHSLPRAQWWAMKDVREYWRGTMLVGYRGSDRVVSGEPRCHGIGKSYVRRGYGRTWHHFTCVVPTRGTSQTEDNVIELTGRLHPTCLAKFCLCAVIANLAPTR
jgi:hypothetical protein